MPCGKKKKKKMLSLYETLVFSSFDSEACSRTLLSKGIHRYQNKQNMQRLQTCTEQTNQQTRLIYGININIQFISTKLY